MSHHISKVTVHLVLKNVPVRTESHPEDITVKTWKEILTDHVESHIRENGLPAVAVLRDYTITDTQYHDDSEEKVTPDRSYPPSWEPKAYGPSS